MRNSFYVAAIACALQSVSANAQQPTDRRNAPVDPTAIRPFRIQVADEQLVELRRRIQDTRWPEKETVADESQGVKLATIQELARYWASGYDWRKVEKRLTELPQFITEIDGLDIHFIHVRSKHKNALPLIVTHGWPGSIIEQLKIIDPLVNPTAYGASAADAFDVVIPSMPGYGFSGKPTTRGWGPERMARAWTELMKRLGYARFVAQGGDWGAFVVDQMGLQAPAGLLAIHTNMPATVPADIDKALLAGEPAPAGLSADEQRAYKQLQNTFKQVDYARLMGSRPQTLYGIADSPVGLATWLLDHNDADGQPAAAVTAALRRTASNAAGELTRDEILDNITLYWLTNTGVSASRLYWEYKGGFFNTKGVAIPVAVTVFPGEQYWAPRSWTERAYPKLIYYNKVDKGGHFAAWEQPLLFATELRAAFKSLRNATKSAVPNDTAIRPFRARVSDAEVNEMRRRLAATRWPDRETVPDHSQGAQLAKLKELVRYWGEAYDWRKAEAKLNALPQFQTRIDGLDIHFIHVRSKHQKALPVIISHGWPGSVFEQIKLIGPLTDPTAYGGKAEDAFDVIIPSLPGYGFSSRPAEPGWGSERIGRAWDVLMKRLGYSRYVAQGGDWGAAIVQAMGRQAPAGLLGIHTNLPATIPDEVGAALGGGPVPAGMSEQERAAFEGLQTFLKKGELAYVMMMNAKPQAVGYGLTDSPAGLAGFMLVHPGFELWTYGADPKQSPTRDDVLDDFTLYWLTNTSASAARIYWEHRGQDLVSATAQKTHEISVPVAITVFPAEVYRPPETWARRAYRNLNYFNKADRGGHFAAWEYPELFSAELRAAFRSLR